MKYNYIHTYNIIICTQLHIHTHLHKDRGMGEGIVDSQEKVGYVDNGWIVSPEVTSTQA